MKHQTLVPPIHRTRTRRGAFTLVEVLVSLGVLMVLMAVILVPINLGMNLFHIGKARSEVQQANQLVINQLMGELKKAVFVFPNESIIGTTDRPPYNNEPGDPDSNEFRTAEEPYYDTVLGTRVSNTGRIDFLLPASDSAGAFLMPPVANNYIVTYYARRLRADTPYDEFSNPMVLWRAQYPYKNDDGTVPSPLPAGFSDISHQRYNDLDTDSSAWLTQIADEPNLESQTDVAGPEVLLASHTQLTPRDMMVVVTDERKANLSPTDPDHSLATSTAFNCSPNRDGKISHVTIHLTLAKYDAVNATGKQSQGIRSTQTVSLPNIR